MAADIVSIRLALTEGDVVTLWAPRWREAGEEWEAFLGDDDALFGFPDAAHLAAFVRTAGEHDLSDHPAWPIVQKLAVEELIPEDDNFYDVVGIPAIAAEEPDRWTVGTFAQTVSMLRSIAEVCDLSDIQDVLDSAEGFALLDGGTLPFTGREGARLWTELSDTVVARWDEVIDALDAIVRIPEVDSGALATAEDELKACGRQSIVVGPTVAATILDESAVDGSTMDSSTQDKSAGFWEEVGIDPILITTEDGEFFTLRCYVDDAPVFLGSDGRLDLFSSPRALRQYLADDGETGHDLASVSTWPSVVEQALNGSLNPGVEEDNHYVLTGLSSDLAAGPEVVDPSQLELAVELLRDVADWAGDKSVRPALLGSEPLGWLVSYVVRPDPTRLAPSPPFDTEAMAWTELVDKLTDRFRTH